MSETTIQKKTPAPLKEKGQYLVAFGVVSVMLYVVGFPFFVIFFLGVLSYFIWKMFSAGARIETRRIFEFYLSANEILRDDERRWYGFEIQEAISKGENIARSMSAAPPLLYFALGSLYHKNGDHAAAFKNLSYILEDEGSRESAIVYPTPELRDYVKLLRKIEREPAEAPLTSAAVRSLERARRNLGPRLLEESRAKVEMASHHEIDDTVVGPKSFKEMVKNEKAGFSITTEPAFEVSDKTQAGPKPSHSNSPAASRQDTHEVNLTFSDRKSISEVLHDIYDENVQ